MKSIADTLAEQGFVAGLRDDHVALIAGCGKNVHVAPGGYLLREGTPADAFFIVRSGQVALELHAPVGGALTVLTVGPGEILGWSWLFEPFKNTFDARAVEDVRAISFDAACLRGKCDADHELGYQLMKRMARVFTERLTATRLQLLDVYGRPGDR